MKVMSPDSKLNKPKITVSEMSSLHKEMRQEIDILAKTVTGHPSKEGQFPDPVSLNAMERRLLVKSIFSFIDAVSYFMKAWAIESRTEVRLTPGERMLALEETYELSDKGDVEPRPAKLRTLSNIQFAFRLLAKAKSADFALNVSQNEWELLRRSLKIRDRLMHPKALRDLNISDVEIRDVLRAFTWFEGQYRVLLLAIIQSLDKKIVKSKRVKFQS